MAKEKIYKVEDLSIHALVFREFMQLCTARRNQDFFTMVQNSANISVGVFSHSDSRMQTILQPHAWQKKECAVTNVTGSNLK